LKRDVDRRAHSRGSFKRTSQEYIVCCAPEQEYYNMEQGDWDLFSFLPAEHSIILVRVTLHRTYRMKRNPVLLYIVKIHA
jgi:hypothetical protein